MACESRPLQESDLIPETTLLIDKTHEQESSASDSISLDRPSFITLARQSDSTQPRNKDCSEAADLHLLKSSPTCYVNSSLLQCSQPLDSVCHQGDMGLSVSTIGMEHSLHGLNGEDQCTTPKHSYLPDKPLCPPPPKKPTSKRKRMSVSPEKFFVPADMADLPDEIKDLFRLSQRKCSVRKGR